MNGEALAQLDKWLTAIADDTSSEPQAKKVADSIARRISSTPATRRKSGALIGAIEKVTDMARCKALFPFAADARLAAGAPATDDVFKCALKPVDAKDYKRRRPPTSSPSCTQVFPDGVCDYAKPGVGQEHARRHLGGVQGRRRVRDARAAPLMWWEE